MFYTRKSFTFILNFDGYVPLFVNNVNCMSLCPLQMWTSPNRTSESCALPPSEDVKLRVVGVGVLGCAGRRCRQMPSEPAVTVYVVPRKVVLTSTPVLAKPHTRAGVSRWSTIWSPRVLDSWKEEEVAAEADTAATQQKVAKRLRRTDGISLIILK